MPAFVESLSDNTLDSTSRPNAAATQGFNDDTENVETSIIGKFLTKNNNVTIEGPSYGPVAHGNGSLENFSLAHERPKETDNRSYQNYKDYGENTARAKFDDEIMYWLESAETEVRFCLYHGITTGMAMMKDELLNQWEEYYSWIKQMRETTEEYERDDEDSFKPEFGEWEFASFGRSKGRDEAYRRLLPLVGYEFSEQEISDLDYESVWEYY